MDKIEQIKDKIDIVDLIQEYIPLKKAGVNYKALCPFHNEKTPSFVVSPHKQIWHCFGCSEGGDIFSFIEKMEGIEFVEALKILAQKAGVSLEGFHKTISKGHYYEIMDTSAIFYHEILKKHPHAEDIRIYLQKRGISIDSIDYFMLGYAPPLWDALLNYLSQKKFVIKDIIKTGLLVNTSGKIYDRFRDRLMFPIKNHNGQIVGFGGRAMKDEKTAKYINTPQTDFYDKSNILYGLYEARFAIKEKNFAIVVEGYFDVILSHQAGVKNTIAVSGTALTENHVKLLKRYTDRIAFCFDADDAGWRATERSFAVTKKAGMQAWVISLPEGKDPADCVLDDVNIWLEAVKNAQKYLDYALTYAKKGLLSKNLKERENALHYLYNLFTYTDSYVEIAYYLKQISELLKIEEKILWEDFKIFKNKNKIKSFKTINANNKVDKPRDYRKDLLDNLFALMIGEISEGVSCFFLPDYFLNYLPEEYKNLYKFLNNSYNSLKDRNDNQAGFRISQMFDILYLLYETNYQELKRRERHLEYKICLKRLLELYFREKLLGLQNALKDAENKENKEEIKNLLQEYKKESENLQNMLLIYK